MTSELKDLKIFSDKIRIAAMEALEEIGAGHIGGVMSMADLMGVLYGKVMKIDPANPNGKIVTGWSYQRDIVVRQYMRRWH